MVTYARGRRTLDIFAFHTMSFLFIVCVMPNQPMVDETFVLRSKELEK